MSFIKRHMEGQYIKDIKDKSGNNDFSFSKKDVTFYNFLTKKAERLTSALYLVTDLISDNEPIKKTLRKRSIDVLLNISQCSAPQDNNHSVFYISSAVSDILSLLSVCVTARLISRMNFEILKKEYDLFNSFLDDKLVLRSLGEVSFGDSFFRPEITEPRAISAKKQIQKNTLLTNTSSVEYKEKIPQNTQNTVSQLNIIDGGKKERQEKILLFFKENDAQVSIKDISSHISGYSEKTLQRDLLELVDSGILKKIGERRWSKYVLNV